MPFAIAILWVSPLIAQSPYPMVNKPYAIGPGDTVQLLNLVIFEPGVGARPAGKRLDIHYSSHVAMGDSAARRAQADRAAVAFGPQALRLGAQRLSISLCDNRTCTEMAAAPAAWYLYEIDATGKWKRAVP